jgi:hypothetical protein
MPKKMAIFQIAFAISQKKLKKTVAPTFISFDQKSKFNGRHASKI